jgi:hypothetical protein
MSIYKPYTLTVYSTDRRMYMYIYNTSMYISYKVAVYVLYRKEYVNPI